MALAEDLRGMGYNLATAHPIFSPQAGPGAAS